MNQYFRRLGGPLWSVAAPLMPPRRLPQQPWLVHQVRWNWQVLLPFKWDRINGFKYDHWDKHLNSIQEPSLYYGLTLSQRMKRQPRHIKKTELKKLAKKRKVYMQQKKVVEDLKKYIHFMDSRGALKVDK